MASLREQAGLPTRSELCWATIQAMRRMPLPASNQAIDNAVADLLRLSDDQRNVMHGDGPQSEVAYCIAWARTYLKVAGAIDRVRQAFWTVTPEGHEITAETIKRRVDEYIRKQRERRKLKNKQNGETEKPGLGPKPGWWSEPEPEPDWQSDLLNRLRKISPQAFEHLAAALLSVAGFDDVEVIGRSGDGGIDGIGIYRPSGLISFRTAFQCKRYQDSVGPGAVRDFRGSFVGRSDRGIIITTGSFSAAARGEAIRDGAHPVDLVDGEQLCELLKEYKLGVKVTERTVEDIDIDDAYFERLPQ